MNVEVLIEGLHISTRWFFSDVNVKLQLFFKVIFAIDVLNNSQQISS